MNLSPSSNQSQLLCDDGFRTSGSSPDESPEVTELRLPAAHWVAKGLFGIVVLLTVLSTLGQISTYWFGHPNLKGFVPLFYVDLESNVPTWYSSLGLALAATVLGLIAAVKHVQRDPFRRQWLLLSALFWLLSMDEIAMIHELPIAPLRATFHTTGVLYYPWVVLGALFVLVVGVCLWGFLRHLPSRTRRGFVLSGAVFVGGAIGVEMLTGIQASLHGEQNATYAMLATVEEFMEMTGVVMMVFSSLDYLQRECGRVRIVVGPGR